MTTNYKLVSDMNIAFGNPLGNQNAVSLTKLKKQCANLANELSELFVALGADKKLTDSLADLMQWTLEHPVNVPDIQEVRDALCDIHVFAYGAHHLMNVDADQDMKDVIEGLMTRFIKDEADKEASIKKHAANGIVQVYFEGEYPKMIMKSAVDQPDAPQGKFVKSASTRKEKLYPVEITLVD